VFWRSKPAYLEPMPPLRTFLVEAYAAGSSEFEPLAEQAQLLASAPSDASIRHLRSILIPEDEICFHLYEAESADSIAAALSSVAMRANRIVEVRS
jgi:hypothetical protein